MWAKTGTTVNSIAVCQNLIQVNSRMCILNPSDCLLWMKTRQPALVNNGVLSHRMATYSVEVFHASSMEAGSYLWRGDNGSNRMTIAHWLS